MRTLNVLIRLQRLRRLQQEAEVANQRGILEQARHHQMQAQQDWIEAVKTEKMHRVCLDQEYLEKKVSVTRVRKWASRLRESIERTKAFNTAYDHAQNALDAATVRLAEREAVLRTVTLKLEKYKFLLERELES
ncbi:hypothetical protein [Burkholderia territorii]|uniref:hypothetical protein n=1 Tax=Burkholderia territorii TaxID=1503055 RepID=UPI000AAC5975|nr:hypothetical protein [Burkholderia territorii]